MAKTNCPESLPEPRRSWWITRGEPVTIQSVTNKEVLQAVTLTHEEAENFVEMWIGVNGMPGALVSSPFSSDIE